MGEVLGPWMGTVAQVTIPSRMGTVAQVTIPRSRIVIAVFKVLRVDERF